MYIYIKTCQEYIGGCEHLKNNVQCTSLGLFPQKIHVQKVPSAHQKSILSKHRAYFPYHDEQQCCSNVEKIGPMSVAPPLHEVAWKVGDP
jgi:hypothetical protein